VSARVEIRFPGTHAGFAQAFARLQEALDAARLDGALRFHAELVFEELVANIINHGAVDGREPDVCVSFEARRDSIVLTFDDDGVPFDPRKRPASVPAALDETRIGGFGLVLVRHAARSLDYLRTASGRNRVTVTLERETHAAAARSSP
jgi:anti-sigma regulatory factor (Ser/Thr protein kinase)